MIKDEAELFKGNESYLLTLKQRPWSLIALRSVGWKGRHPGVFTRDLLVMESHGNEKDLLFVGPVGGWSATTYG